MILNEQDDVRLLKSTDEIWAGVQEILRKRMKLPTYHAWVSTSRLVEVGNGEAVIAVFNDTGRAMIMNHLPAITDAISDGCGERVVVRVKIDPSMKAPAYVPSIFTIPAAEPRAENVQEGTAQRQAIAARNAVGMGAIGRAPTTSRTSAPSLNAKYTFESFVVGSNNRFMHSAALAVAKSPGQAYNPLFIYGGVGLGKTHIMQAIAHEILRHTPNMSIRYLSCEKFTNELVTSIREDRMAEFRKRYRQVDVLLVDDIQFIQGKESTQEEFFHTFNALRESGKQIVLSSDRPPKAISHLEERLRSRFEWGLIADIQTPDLETRLAILQKKCEQERMQVSDDALEYIATIFTTNIRELEGALIRANAYASLTGTPLTLGTLSEVLQPGGEKPPSRPKITIDQLIDTVAAHYRLESSEIRSSKRSQDLALPRHIAMYLAHEVLQMSFPRIGQAFGNRKHTSALYAYGRIKEQLPNDPALNEALRQIRRQAGC